MLSLKKEYERKTSTLELYKVFHTEEQVKFRMSKIENGVPYDMHTEIMEFVETCKDMIDVSKNGHYIKCFDESELSDYEKSILHDAKTTWYSMTSDFVAMQLEKLLKNCTFSAEYEKLVKKVLFAYQHYVEVGEFLNHDGDLTDDEETILENGDFDTCYDLLNEFFPCQTWETDEEHKEYLKTVYELVKEYCAL